MIFNPLEKPQPRFYYLPLKATCLPGCEICYSLGCKNTSDREVSEIEKIIRRAEKSGFDAMLFSPSLLLHPEREYILAATLKASLRPILQIQWKVALQYHKQLLTLTANGLFLNLVFTGHESADQIHSTALSGLAASPAAFFTLAPDKFTQAQEFLEILPEPWLEKIYFHFTPYVPGKNLLTVREVFSLLEKIRKKTPSLKIRPPLGREVWDPRIDDSLALESDIGPSFSLQAKGSSPNISVVIPSFNSGPLLKNTLRHLMQQDIPRSDYEIIVVDDGSTDNNQELIRNFVAPEAGSLHFKYLYFPRVKPRKQGDGNFRAGIARNLGVKHARGDLLVFLDSDIIVPPHYLRNLEELHQKHDVVQSVRMHLKNKKRNELAEYASINQRKDTYILEKNYWGAFFQVKKWQELHCFWKYTCTYALSIKTAHFKKAGWFRRTFVYYGFEDTDLGFRLAKMGLKFHLDKTVTYHLDTEADRSEYRQSNLERYLILSKTAKVFYLNNLDPVIYRNLVNMLGNEKSFKEIMGDLKKKSRHFLPILRSRSHAPNGTAPRI